MEKIKIQGDFKVFENPVQENIDLYMLSLVNGGEGRYENGKYRKQKSIFMSAMLSKKQYENYENLLKKGNIIQVNGVIDIVEQLDSENNRMTKIIQIFPTDIWLRNEQERN